MMINYFISRHSSEILISLALSIMILVCYQPVSEYDFINYDDPLYVTDNEHVQAGVTMEGILWAFRDLKSTNWHPLTWLSHMLDWQLFRANAGGHHWTSVVIHLVNAILLFYLFRLMTGSLWRSACVAALFAVHPINVESVAWVAERKNVLSTCLGLLTLLLYVFYIRKPGWKRYLPVLGAFTLGLMAKPMLVTLPFLMLLLDYWPLGRFMIHPPAEDSRSPLERSRQMPAVMSVSRLVMEKIPLLMMAAGSIALTIMAARWGGAMTTLARFPFTARLANSLNSYVSYIGKFFWPEGLAVFYPYPRQLDILQTISSGVLITSVTVLVLKQHRLRPYLLVGWFWFLGTLVPVIGLVQVGLQAMADRYAYFPLIGLFTMLVWGALDLSTRSKRGRETVIFFFALLTLVGGFVTRHQLGFWENSRTLFTHALSVTEENDIAHSNLARPLFEDGQWEDAAAHYREAIRINPRYANHYNNLGAVLVHQGKIDEAIVQYKTTLTLNPGHTGALFNMGLALESLKRWSEADAFYEAVIREDPDHRYAPLQRGMLAMKMGNYRDAAAIYQEALLRRPDDPRLKEALFRARERADGLKK
ncbi:MAG: tetratricopeptide repeat protein [Syntrophales bacterium]